MNTPDKLFVNAECVYKSTELYEAKNLVFNLLNWTLGNSNLNIFWQYSAISISVVLNNFIKNRFITQSLTIVCLKRLVDRLQGLIIVIINTSELMCTVCVSGGLVSTGEGIPTGAITHEVRWWNYLYSTVVCATCLFVSLVGGALFGKTTIFIFSVRMSAFSCHLCRPWTCTYIWSADMLYYKF